jgi:hypothetical protein
VRNSFSLHADETVVSSDFLCPISSCENHLSTVGRPQLLLKRHERAETAERNLRLSGMSAQPYCPAGTIRFANIAGCCNLPFDRCFFRKNSIQLRTQNEWPHFNQWHTSATRTNLSVVGVAREQVAAKEATDVGALAVYHLQDIEDTEALDQAYLVKSIRVASWFWRAF